MWRLIFKKIFNRKVIVTTDSDGAMRWRFVYKDPRGGYRARAIMGWVSLDEDGTFLDSRGHRYLKTWKVV